MRIHCILYKRREVVMKSDVFLEKLKKRADRLFTKSNWNLLVELSRANFMVRDHNSVLGVFWSFLAPLSLLAVMYFVFRIRFGQEITTYPLYLLIGIIFISFFVTATTYIIKIFFTNRDVVLNSTVPREILIVSNLSIHTYKFIIELILCWVLTIFFGVFAWRSLLLLLPLLIAYMAFVLGVGLIISLVYCFARDIEHIWMIVSRLLFFATPIFYSLDSISSPLARRIIYWGNPLTPFLISFQGIFMKIGSVYIVAYAHSLLLGGGFFILGYYAFIILENTALEQA